MFNSTNLWARGSPLRTFSGQCVTLPLDGVKRPVPPCPARPPALPVKVPPLCPHRPDSSQPATSAGRCWWLRRAAVAVTATLSTSTTPDSSNLTASGINGSGTVIASLRLQHAALINTFVWFMKTELVLVLNDLMTSKMTHCVSFDFNSLETLMDEILWTTNQSFSTIDLVPKFLAILTDAGDETR